jgi:hypothetical protein
MTRYCTTPMRVVALFGAALVRLVTLLPTVTVVSMHVNHCFQDPFLLFLILSLNSWILACTLRAGRLCWLHERVITPS